MHSRLALLPLLLSACTATSTTGPSLAPRAAEAIDPRVPIPNEVVAGPADAAMAAYYAQEASAHATSAIQFFTTAP